jgi:SAM-dependent methyltransferase
MGTGIVTYAKKLARPLVHRIRRGRDRIRLGSVRFDGDTPLSWASGFDRGTPIDRFYIERFLAAHRKDIHGRVLEIGEDKYSRRFGGHQVARQDILHIDESNPAATLVGDLSDPSLLPADTFDCIVLTQPLQYVFDVGAALNNVRSALRVGGTALITVPGVAPISIDDWQDRYYWRFTLPSVNRLLADSFGQGHFCATAGGNLLAATAFLHGAAVEEVGTAKLEPVMSGHAIVLMARAVRHI